MGKQKGFVKLLGTYDDTTFSKTKDGYSFKQKSEIKPGQFLSNPKMEKQRHNAAEFGASGKAVKLLRRVFVNQIDFAKDARLTPRMQKLMMAITKGDTTHGRGERLPYFGPLEMLEGLQCNIETPLFTAIKQETTTEFDRATGKARFKIPAFVPAQSLVRPDNVTHYRIMLAAAEVDFEDESFNLKTFETANLPISNVAAAAVNISVDLNANSTLPVFVLAGIRYLEVVSGIDYPDVAGNMNALQIGVVSTV